MSIHADLRIAADMAALEQEVNDLEDRIADLEGVIRDALDDLRVLPEVPLGEVETAVEAIRGQLREAL